MLISGGGSMVSVLRVHLPSDIPIAGYELSPHVLLQRPDTSITTAEIPEQGATDGFYLRCRWYRVHIHKRVAVCSVHPSEPATLQCLDCVKAKLAVGKSYHCSPKCFADSWRHHRTIHQQALAAALEHGPDEDEIYGRINLTSAAALGSGGSRGSTPSSTGVGCLAPTLSNCSGYSSPAQIGNQGGRGDGGSETWYEVGREKTYTPTVDDVGHVLRFECIAVDANSGVLVAPSSTLLTSRVISAPSPTPRRLVSANSPEVLLVSIEIEYLRTALLLAFLLLFHNMCRHFNCCFI